MSTTPAPWLEHAVAEFGKACKSKLAGPGDREASIRAPIEVLLAAAGQQLGLQVVPHDEVRDVDRGVRPDYAISVAGVITGYVEVKKPGRSVNPGNFTGHDKQQWERQRDLPNLLYTNGTEWRLWHDSEPVGEPIYLTGGPLEQAGEGLASPARFESVLAEFLRWSPDPITSVSTLVRAIAPLTRLLRGEVLDQLILEARRISAGADLHAQPFHGLAADWRSLLFPEGDDATFADGYAQTVTFALLLARSEGIDLEATNLHDVGQRLGQGHSLMGRALQLLTDDAAPEFRVTIDLLLRVINAVRWDRVRGGKRDTYLYLYEDFLDEYDTDLRKKSGSYYTPLPLVEQMVRLAEDALRTRLGKTTGFLDPSVLTVDPAMGTGTYLNAIIERAARRAVEQNGPGVGAGVVADLAQRLVGFELQMGPYAVAELRASDLLRAYNASPPAGGMRTFVTNTLDDPYTEIDQIASSLQVISASRRRANDVKGSTPVTVVIGNPPYRRDAEDQGGWIEHGRGSAGKAPKAVPLDDFRAADNGLNEYVLKNLYVFFWRWATWKVFDAHAQDRAGIVCFVTTNAYMRGRGFKGMREYLRRSSSEGWIINLSPEGHRPDVSTRVFPGVQNALAIGLFVRDPQTDETTPATIRYTQVSGRRDDKHKQVAALELDGPDWRRARDAWHAPFTPAAESAWDAWPAADDLMPWTAPGVKPNRTWVYAPAADTLAERWRELVAEADPARKKRLFQESDSATLTRDKTRLPGDDTHNFIGPFENETGAPPTSVRVGFRVFDRQWLIPDARLIHRESPSLWQARRVKDQVFVVEQSAQEISDGPGLLFTALIPDMHFFNARGGRVLAMRHPDGTPNLAPGVAAALNAKLDRAGQLPVEDLVAYLAGVTSHPAFTATFDDELTTPGIRVPLTANPDLWDHAVKLGREVVWLHTFGEAFADKEAGREKGGIRYPSGDARQPLCQQPVKGMPDSMSYNPQTEVLTLGTGSWFPVSPAVRAYTVGGREVLDSWFNLRKSKPTFKRTKKTSPLADIHPTSWPTEWTLELNDLLTVVSRLVELEEDQANLLTQILTGTLISSAELQAVGVAWPRAKKNRRVRLPVSSEGGLAFGESASSG
jgi:hypothetical protein